MEHHDLDRFKTPGMNRGIDAVAAPTPDQLGTLVGASALVTAANHTRTGAPQRVYAGGGQRV